MEAHKILDHKIVELRRQIGAIDGTAKKEVVRFSGYEAGFPKSAVVEIAGSGKTELVAQFLSEHPELRVAWIESELSVFPLALMQRKVAMGRVLFVEGGANCLWTAQQVLQSQLFHVVVLSHLHVDERILRKLQLATEKSEAMVLSLNANLSSSWVSRLQIEVSRLSAAQGLLVKTKRQRGLS